MWRKLWLFLVLVRLYFAFQPSYIHPDEHFQGPEVITGLVFGRPSHQTWEFKSSNPIRSFFPLWLIYGAPLTLLEWIWGGLGYGPVPARVAFYTLRLVMFMLSFILEDWAIHELIALPKDRRVAITLIASSYVTWTFQTHTFSNSIETLIVLWVLVLIKRIRDDIAHTQNTACIVLAFHGVLGIFNRITFPAFILIPAAQLLPHLLHKPLRIPVILITASVVLFSAVLLDTAVFSGIPVASIRFRDLPTHAVFTPWNNLIYNLDSSNLAKHGLHPVYQHFLVNLPQLLGPAVLLLPFSDRSTLFWTAIAGTALLSCFQHQEARFLQPAVPLLLTSIRLPKRFTRVWVTAWIVFNTLAGVLFGTYHQGGIVSAQTWIAAQPNVTDLYYWKTYSPPHYLLDGRAVLYGGQGDLGHNGSNSTIQVTDLMGLDGNLLVPQIASAMYCASIPPWSRTFLVAPASGTFLDQFTNTSTVDWSTDNRGYYDLQLKEVWRHRAHIGLDDLDFGEDGIWPTLQRVIGRRGLVVWEASSTENCLR
ncbi:alpha 1,2 mannosyltransferase [Oleoguttula sp. CCFEE 5521]